jgi:hypothetical protein
MGARGQHVVVLFRFDHIKAKSARRTLVELAQVTGYKDYSLANFIPRGRFEGRIEFALRQVRDANGFNRRRLVITHVGKPRKRS